MIYKNRAGRLLRLVEIRGDKVVLEDIEKKMTAEIPRRLLDRLTPTSAPIIARYVCPSCESAIKGPDGLRLVCEKCETELQAEIGGLQND